MTGLRLKGTLTVRDGAGRTTTAARARIKDFYLEDVELTAQRAKTQIGIIHDPGHDQAWIIAMSDKPSDRTALEYSERWGIEPMFSDFKSRGFGIDNTQIRYPDRLARLLLEMAGSLQCRLDRAMGRGSSSHPCRKRVEPTTRQGGALQTVILHPRPTAHRNAHAGPSPSAAPLENILRIVIGLTLLISAYDVLTGLWVQLAAAIGAVLMVTALIGICPAYSPFGVNTCPDRLKGA